MIILPVKTILLRILVNVVVWAQFEFKVTFVIGSDLDGDLNFLFRFISFYNYSIGIFSRNFMGFRSHPRITANTTFASMTLLVLKIREKFIIFHVQAIYFENFITVAPPQNPWLSL